MSTRDDMTPLPELGDAFQAAMAPEARHQRGAHYTRSAQILKIVGPTLRDPFLDRIKQATNETELRAVLHAIRSHRVLDPACGCGHFFLTSLSLSRCCYTRSPRGCPKLKPWANGNQSACTTKGALVPRVNPLEAQEG